MLLYLAKILGTTADKILSGGSIVVQRSKRVSISEEKEGFFSLSGMRYYFGEIVLLSLRAMKEYAEKIKNYLYEIADDTYVTLIDVDLLRFKTGDAKAVLSESVRGKDVLIIDNIIASDDTLLDVAAQLSVLGAKRIFAVATFGFFTNGTEKFDKAHENGILEAVFVTNASHVGEHIKSADWYREIDVIKYIFYYIYCVNSGYSIAKLGRSA